MTAAKKPIEQEIPVPDEPFVPTVASAWPKRQDNTLEVTLPSGGKARIRRPSYWMLGKQGQVPKDVAGAEEKATAARNSAGKRTNKVEPSTADMDAEEFDAFMTGTALMADFLVCKSFQDPKVFMVPRKDEVWIGDVSADDKAYVVEALDIEVM